MKEVLNPFDNNYKGRVVVLMNGDGFSSVGQLASIYKDKGRATFVGETLGSNQYCTANQKQFELTNSKFNYTVARNIFITDVREKNTGARIEPDYYVEPTVDEYLADKDVALEKALSILKKE